MGAEIRNEHDELRLIMRCFRVLMDSPQGPDHPDMLKERMRFSKLFAKHYVGERGALVRMAGEDDGAGLRDLLARYDTMSASLRQDYSAHINSWTPARIRAEWGSYRMSVIGLQTKLTALMEWEEAKLPLFS